MWADRPDTGQDTGQDTGWRSCGTDSVDEVRGRSAARVIAGGTTMEIAAGNRARNRL